MLATRLVDSMVELLTSTPRPEDVLSYKLSEELQLRAAELLERNREGLLTPEEKEELDQFIFLEHVFRLAKARARMQLAA